jgi:hypothetical protein
MRHSILPIRLLLCCALMLWLCSGVVAETLYSDDLAWQLASPGEIKRVTNIRARLRKEDKDAEPLFVLAPPPFEEITAAPNIMGNVPVKPKSWDLPPWPTVDPPIPADLPQATRELMAARRKDQTADVWSELDPAGDQEPSVLLRPIEVPVDQQIVVRANEIPPPFSLRRYYDSEEVFIEVAAYGGTTSFNAEKAFRALKEAATRQKSLDGVGQEAFLTRVEVFEDTEEEDALPFEELAPAGEQRPELLDSGSAEALLAPAFQDVPVKGLEGRRISFADPSKKVYRKDGPEVKQSVLVIVAFFPEQALTVSLSIEERMGTVQDLVAVAMLVQRKILNEIERG